MRFSAGNDLDGSGFSLSPAQTSPLREQLDENAMKHAPSGRTLIAPGIQNS
jgi:hypothetical protein